MIEKGDGALRCVAYRVGEREEYAEDDRRCADEYAVEGIEDDRLAETGRVDAVAPTIVGELGIAGEAEGE